MFSCKAAGKKGGELMPHGIKPCLTGTTTEYWCFIQLSRECASYPGMCPMQRHVADVQVCPPRACPSASPPDAMRHHTAPVAAQQRPIATGRTASRVRRAVNPVTGQNMACHLSGRRCRCHALARHSLQGGCRSEKRPGQPPGETRTHPHLIGQGVQT